jgi:8-oxo-dGTP pyrophosphatase MutT (NUDIX family)
MQAGEHLGPDRPRQPAGLAALHQRFGDVAIRIANLFRPHLSLGVRLVALDGEGGVFLVRHSYLPGLHLPGGAVDPGETCREAAVREAVEEGGLELAGPPELFHLYWNPIGGRRDHVALFVARGARQSAPRRPSLEILSARFHPVEALPADATAGTLRRLGEVIGGAPVSDRW